MRARTARPILALFAALTLAACGGDDDDGGGGGGGGGVDAGGGGAADAGGQPVPDASTSLLGQVCDPAAPDCPADVPTCVAFSQGGMGICTRECTTAGMVDPACTEVHSGPVLAGCFVTVMPQGGGENLLMCGIVCEAPGAPCTDEVCDGTCPTGLTCTPNPGQPEVSSCIP